MNGRAHSSGAALALFFLLFFFPCLGGSAVAQNDGGGICTRPAPGSEITSPREIRSQHGVLQVSLALRASTDSTGETRYCYVDEKGNQAPTLRLLPGDLLVFKLKNELPNPMPAVDGADHQREAVTALALCTNPAMSPASTNLHFHGLAIPPVCHQDDVLRTSIEPGSASYEYRLRIAPSQPPGLYWYHPHPHGHSEEQVLGGASGALIVEGIERFNPLLAGLPERLLVIRDQVRSSSASQGATKYGLKPPSKDLSVNSVPVPYPDYPPAVMKIKPSQPELWRVLNASADTFLDLHLLSNGKWQLMGLIAVDGVPIGYEAIGPKATGRETTREDNRVRWLQNIPIPPGGRAEFLFEGPPEGGQAQLLTAGVDTAPSSNDDEDAVTPANAGQPIADDDDYTPPRWLLTAKASADALPPAAILPKSVSGAESPNRPTLKPALMSIRPTRERKLYFSEKVLDAKNPRSTIFYVTEEGQQPKPFRPSAPPNITVRQGAVEDWVIENRSREIHSFHIHQTHFIVLERDGTPVKENYLRDSVAVPYWDGVSSLYPSVKVRIDFRDPAILGTFPYHCHILQHEDGGMMGTIRVLKAITTK
jgi:FtsP/CotA-like multicopper oxidase with cupredoxin domain